MRHWNEYFCYRCSQGNFFCNILYLVTCGSRPSITRIVGGTVAAVNSWPWQVMVTDEHGNHFCGGSLVDTYWVVTTASCMVGMTLSRVRIRYQTISIHFSFQTLRKLKNSKISKINENDDDVRLWKLRSQRSIWYSQSRLKERMTQFQLKSDGFALNYLDT